VSLASITSNHADHRAFVTVVLRFARKTLADGGGFEPLMLTYVKAINCLYYTVYIQVFFKYCPNFLPPPITNQKKFLLFGKILKFLQGGVVFKASAIFQLLFY
jgi:hypothetical protein